MLDFTLPSNKENNFTLSTCNKPLVIFFYPRDNTPGCTIENQDFAKLYNEFVASGVEVIGISRDSISSHCKFSDKFSLPFALLSDSEEVVCNLFNVMRDKNMYGKKVRGIERSTFILDKEKSIIKEYRKVKVANHAQEVLDFIKVAKL
ncbi:MAG: peroxiredoxin [Neisseriaceae bacterium]